MAITSDLLNSLVSVTQFNKGQASKIFDRLRTERQLVVLKNNAPSAVILSPEEYERLSDIEEDYRLLLLAQERINGGALEHTISFHDAMADLGISDSEIEEAEELEIE
ncbi:Phd_YefM [uncultured Roseburia sp.]|uniref:Antitoxin n=1 Tax=Brotonthovivens ammoniilytica TaxID=2981725 RepID=A0ABT2TFZ3_9FIRM|nr:type II toxin-antitoxin system Phd/YefM family antitoxin [Brotonthovivens ammoniilytica]MCU6761104.1 type II toxin-antitoxin system Phd/YefM family antitoxin [Brotonthovivens ammoniilytica]SCI18979.1 Phd_YefM [uncultured Roseburia sp.]